MEIKLIRAAEEDLKLIHQMQLSAFKKLLNKYQDFDTNPATEPFENIIKRYNQDFTTYFLILFKGQSVGAIRLAFDSEMKKARISPMFILPKFHGQMIGQTAIKEIENLFPDTEFWEINTILQEEKLCRFYEKAGYCDTGKRKNIKQGMDIVFYKKRVCKGCHTSN